MAGENSPGSRTNAEWMAYLDARPQEEWDAGEAEMLRGPGALIYLPRYVRVLGLLRYGTMKRWGVQNCHIHMCIEHHSLFKVAYGLYSTAGVSEWARSPVAQVMASSIHVVAALYTALMIHGLMEWSNAPPWFGTFRRNRLPKLAFEVQWLRWAHPRVNGCVEVVAVDGVEFNVTTPARTIADFFAHRQRLPPGEPLRMLALYRASSLFDEEKLLEAAALCRVTKLVRSALRYC